MTEHNTQTTKHQITDSPLGCLEITTEYPSDASPENSQKRRYDLLTHAQTLLPEERIRVCMNHMQQDAIAVELYTNENRSHVGFGNLMTCGSVWTCPVCSARISEERRIELSQGIQGWKAQGYRVAMMTNTLHHNRGQSLADVLDTFSRSWALFTSGRAWQEVKDVFDVAGTVRALEVTHGDNGWHVHSHTLLFIASSDDTTPELMTEELSNRWVSSVQKRGGKANKQAFDLSEHDGAIADYVNKFGKLPEQPERFNETGWGESHEIAKGTVKNARTKHGRTPFALLEDSMNGDKKAGALFQEYARAFKGRRQLVWSHGLKDILLIEEIELSEDLPENERETIAWIPRETWRQVIRGKHRAQIIDMVRKGHDRDVHTLLERCRAVRENGYTDLSRIKPRYVGRL